MKFILFCCLAFLNFQFSFAHLNRDELPQTELSQKDIDRPNKLWFKKTQMVIQSDSILHYGFQHTVHYTMKWTSDSTFNLYVLKHRVKNNNPLSGRKRDRKKRRNQKSGTYDFFYLSKFSDWYLEDLGNGDFRLNSLEKTHTHLTFSENTKREN